MTDPLGDLVVKTIQIKITGAEELALESKRGELQRLFPGLTLSDTAICRHLIHSGLGLNKPEQEANNEVADEG